MDATLHTALLHIHSVGRWIVLLLLVIAIFNSMVAGERPFIKSDNRTGLLLTIFADLMFVVGAILWYYGPIGYQFIKNKGGMSALMKEPTDRFFAVEHLVGMLIAIILIHIGKVQGRKKIGDRAKHKRTLIFYLLALLIILVTIPWPFRLVGAGSHWY
ncbi:MAG: hypothetical protein NVS1B13_06250 [Flavisolibacter sp.]